MSGRGGTRPAHRAAALVVSMLLVGGMAGCAYRDASDPQQPASSERSGRPAPSVPTKSPRILDLEAENYAELKKRLAAAPGSVLLDDSGPADGPGVGFSKTATVKIAGSYTVTAACVGIEHAQVFLSQEAGAELSPLDIDCSGVLSQVIELKAGYVGAQLVRQDPNGPWTGAVAGIRITVT